LVDWEFRVSGRVSPETVASYRRCLERAPEHLLFHVLTTEVKLQAASGDAKGALREVREETALEIEPREFLGFWLEPYDGRIVLCLAWTARVIGEPRAGDDLVDLRWFEPDGLPGPSELAFSHYPEVLSAALGRDQDS
jgi:hypothetical protein